MTKKRKKKIKKESASSFFCVNLLIIPNTCLYPQPYFPGISLACDHITREERYNILWYLPLSGQFLDSRASHFTEQRIHGWLCC